jgi:putative membrane protein
MPEWNMYEPQRQSMLGAVVYAIRNFRVMLSLFVTLLALGAANPTFFFYASFVVGPLVVFLIVLAWYQYNNFTFHVDPEEGLVIHKGVFFKERVVIPVDRIQAIQITENVVQRILSVVALKVDTAGSKGNELQVHALELERAEALKALLYKARAAAKAGPAPNPEEAPPCDHTTPHADPAHEPKAHAKEKPGELLVHLSLWDLTKVGLTENHLRTGAVVLAVVIGYAGQYQQLIQEYLEQYVDEYAEQVASAGYTLLLSLLLLYIGVSVLISMVRTFLRFFDLKAVLHTDAVEISTGLLKRQHDRIPIGKIQYVQWETNPLRRLAGYESAKLRPSNPVGDVQQRGVNEIPALNFSDSERLAKAIFAAYEEPTHGFEANATAYARFAAILWTFILIPAAVGIYVVVQWWCLTVLALYIPVVFFAWQNGKRVRVYFNHTYLMVRKGWVFPKRMVLASHKLQSVGIQSHVLLKRRRLCHLVLHTAAGTRMVRYMSERDAAQLRDYLLYQIERYNQPWM